MNTAPYIPLAGFFINVCFALFVFSRAPQATANRVYLLLGLSIATWNVGSYHLFVVNTPGEALFWARFLQFGCIFGVVAFFHLSLVVAGITWRWIRWLYGFQCLLALTNFTPLFIKDVRDLGTSGWYAVAGPAFHVFNVPFLLMFGSIFVLVKTMRTLPRMQRQRLRPLILSQALLTILGTNDVLPINGIDYYPFTSVQVYPWGSLAAVFYGIITAYAVIQHELLNIHVGLTRLAAHVIRFAFLMSIALGLLLGVQVVTGTFTPGGVLFVYFVSTVLASVLFPRLFGAKGVEKWERRFLGDHFEHEDRVHAFIETMPWFRDLAGLLTAVHEVLIEHFRLRSYTLILRDETNRAFTIFRAHPEPEDREVPELKVPSPVFQFFEWGKSEFLSLNPASSRTGGTVLERQARKQLERFPGEAAFPLISERELFGLLVIGTKEDDEPSTSADLRLLTTLVKNISLMVNQLRLKDQILRTHELDLLGRMSRGMAHDLNNLLTPISTLLQLAQEGASSGPLDEELLSIALRNTRTVRAYIREALFFSENLRPDIQPVRLDVIVEQTAELALSNRRKIVGIETATPGEVLAELDEVLIQRLLSNLISNAIDASVPGSTVRVELARLVKTEAARDWLRLSVIDNGEGIKKENLERVQTAYFTTKNRGDEGRGFGLGLAICRKIVALHGGNLSIASQLTKGTTVQVDLPSHPVQPAISATSQAA